MEVAVRNGIALLGFIFMTSHAAVAALGNKVDSIAKDQKRLSAKLKSAQEVAASTNPTEKYTVQELVSDANTVKEFIDQNGVIFAVSWQGLSPPDLSVLLGSYYSQYNTTQKNLERPHGKRQQTVEANTLVVQRYGHMRDLRGRAYDTNLVPSGISIDDIK